MFKITKIYGNHKKPTEKEVEDLAKLICFLDNNNLDYELGFPESRVEDIRKGLKKIRKIWRI